MVSVPPRTAGAPVQQQADGDGAAGGLAGLPGHRRLQPAQRCRHLPGGPGGHRPHTQSGRQEDALKGPEDGFLSFLNPSSNHYWLIPSSTLQTSGNDELQQLQKALLDYLDANTESETSLVVSFHLACTQMCTRVIMVSPVIPRGLHDHCLRAVISICALQSSTSQFT